MTFELGPKENNKQQDREGREGLQVRRTEVWKNATEKEVSREKWTEIRAEGSLEPVV